MVRCKRICRCAAVHDRIGLSQSGARPVVPRRRRGRGANDPVIAFRILPRRIAAAVFEYMPASAQNALVKAMGQEEVAALLNQMSPDDRTWFLSELPANVTKQLLTLLTPEERREAVTLLG